METQNNSNPGLFSGIFYLIASFIMLYMFFAFLVLAVAIAISQPEVNLFLTVYYYLVLTTALWFFIYGILMFFRQFSKKKALTVTNLIFILFNFAAFVYLCVIVNSVNLGAVFQLMWLYLVIMVVGFFASVSLLRKIKKSKQSIQPNPVEAQPVTPQQEVYTVDGNTDKAQLDIDLNKSDGIY